MANRDSILAGILRSPIRLLAIILILVFTTEVAVMLLIPFLIPGGLGDTAAAFLDAILLTLVCAPVLWLVILAAKRAEQERIAMVREQEALRSQQMATLAQLATGVAHEIRNPLTSIKMMIQVNRSKFAEEGLPTDDLELVEHEIRRMERSVNSLLEYARPQHAEIADVVLQKVIRNLALLVETRCQSQGVELKVDVPETASHVLGDAGQLQQLLLNLVLNSLDAMTDGGTLSVRLSKSPKGFEVSVTDTGNGICPSVEEKLFQPFVTTKNNGVGLGLGICRRIALAHGGSLAGFNRATNGAEFRLTLPKATGDGESAQSANDPTLRSSPDEWPTCEAS